MPCIINQQDQSTLIKPVAEIKMGQYLQCLTAIIDHESLYCKGF